ncbi:MAG: hypothetical protein IJH07_00125 [Ruminococcus sp.]|nr:hypothetical protein [Ruminococcus sp.]
MKNVITKVIYLQTPKGIVSTPLRIEVLYPDTDLPMEDMDPDSIEMYLTYKDTVYHGKGTDYLYADTLADLQVNLPENISICCCLTCRHGNMCPYGNRPDLLWCTKDIIINSKEDMCLLFDSENYESREVSSFGYCSCFSYQNNDDYTYNDYGYVLRNRKKGDINV